MAEDGYEWDVEKLELKKVEQKSVVDDKDAEKASEEYRSFRMSCGIKDPVMLNEIKEAYYEGAIRKQKLAKWSEDKFAHIVGCLVQDIVANEHMTEAEKQPTKFFVEKYYKKYDESFDNRIDISNNIKSIFDLIGNLLGESIKETNFKTVPIFNCTSDVSGADVEGSKVILSCITTKKSFPSTSTFHASIHASLVSNKAKYLAFTHPV